MVESNESSKRKPKNPIKFKVTLNEEQKKAKAIILENTLTLLAGKAGCGKAQPLYSNIYTPDGIVKMGDLKIGDSILGVNKIVKVIGIYPQGVEDVYEIKFSDKTKTVCSLSHLWSVQRKKSSSDSEWIIKTTKELLDDIQVGIEYRIPSNEISHFKHKKVLINPYLMGILLSEGNLREGTTTFSTSDSFIIDKLSNILSDDDVYIKHKSNYDYSIKKKNRDNNKHFICKILSTYNLNGKLSYDKFIPDDYKYNSEEVRIELLRGLMDGDGFISKKGLSFYNTSSEKLANDVAEVFRSFGARVIIRHKFPKYLYKGEMITSIHSHYELAITVKAPERFVSLPRKRDRLLNRKSDIKYTNRIIKSISKIGQTETQCIKVDSEDELYITDNFIVTHNTLLACQVALDGLFTGQYSKVIITRPTVSKEEIGFLPGDLREKMDPWVQPIYQNMFILYNKDKILKEIEEGRIEIVPVSFMRGRAQPLTSKILTPNGWKLMGDMILDDSIIGKDGETYKVTGIFPQGVEKVYKITFSDNSEALASGEHLWEVYDIQSKSSKVINTNNIKENLFCKNGQKRYKIPLVSPVKFKEKDLPIDPYVLGVLLGDGCISQNNISLCTNDLEIIENVKCKLPKDLTLKKRKGYNSDYGISKKVRNNHIKNDIIESLKILNLHGKKSYDKFIPEIYLYGSIEQRLELLRGLMDTDGSIFSAHKDRRKTSSVAEYYTVSPKLLEGFKFLIHSLGGTTNTRIKDVAGTIDKWGRVYNYDIYQTKVRLSQNLNPFKLKRKSELFKVKENPVRLIKSVDLYSEEETQCISVSAEDQLYVTDNCIVTHNTFLDSMIIVDEAQNVTHEQMEMITTRIGLRSKMIICGDDAQIDLKNRGDSGFRFLYTLGSKIKDMESVHLHTNHRDPIVDELLDHYAELRLRMRTNSGHTKN